MVSEQSHPATLIVRTAGTTLLSSLTEQTTSCNSGSVTSLPCADYSSRRLQYYSMTCIGWGTVRCLWIILTTKAHDEKTKMTSTTLCVCVCVSWLVVMVLVVVVVVAERHCDCCGGCHDNQHGRLESVGDRESMSK